MLKKLSLIICALALCCGASVRSAKPQDERLTVRSTTIKPPITILNATRNATELSIEIKNESDATVEYLELHIGASRVFRGRNTAHASLAKGPEWEATPVLSFPPQEVRRFTFPRPASNDTVIKIEFVLLSNGKGWFQGVPLIKFAEPRADGMLWGVDKTQQPPRRVSKVRAPLDRHVGKSAPTPQSCYYWDDFLFHNCHTGQNGEPQGFECGFFFVDWAQFINGMQIDMVEATCFYPYELEECGPSSLRWEEVGLCP